MLKKEIAIIGSGPAALITASKLAPFHNVTIYEKKSSIGNKFLVAGKGGFNLTNSLEGIELASKYSPREFMKDAILSFDSIALRKWLANLGIPTFVGTSGRVFPEKGIKPTEVLNKIKKNLLEKNVLINCNSQFVGFNNFNGIEIDFKGEIKSVFSDIYIFSLGGASWSITGSDGKWTEYFEKIGVKTLPFESSNCGININWNEKIELHFGKPLKNIAVSVSGKSLKGEAVITNYGLEGNVVYPLIPKIREQLKADKSVEIFIDFKPNNSKEGLIKKLNLHKSTSNYGEILNLNRVQMAFIKSFLTKEEYLSPKLFVGKLKNLCVKVNSIRNIEESISTVGGIDTEELNSDFSLKIYPNIYTIGEMVNWDAPTGGFLLQGSFSMGNYAGKSILNILG